MIPQADSVPAGKDNIPVNCGGAFFFNTSIVDGFNNLQCRFVNVGLVVNDSMMCVSIYLSIYLSLYFLSYFTIVLVSYAYIINVLINQLIHHFLVFFVCEELIDFKVEERVHKRFL